MKKMLFILLLILTNSFIYAQNGKKTVTLEGGFTFEIDEDSYYENVETNIVYVREGSDLLIIDAAYTAYAHEDWVNHTYMHNGEVVGEDKTWEMVYGGYYYTVSYIPIWWRFTETTIICYETPLIFYCVSDFTIKRYEGDGDLVYSKNYKIDGDAPKIEIKTDVKDVWLTEKEEKFSMELKITDIGSGVKEVKVIPDDKETEVMIEKKDKNIYIITCNKEVHTNITIEATDNVSNKSTLTKEIKIDRTSPTLEVSEIPESWVKEDLYLEVNAEDRQSGLKSLTVKDNSDGTEFKPNSEGKYQITKEGKYTISIEAEDNAGNQTELEKEIKLDKTVPKIEAGKLEYVKAGRLIKTIKAEAKAEDGVSGISNDKNKVYIESNKKNITTTNREGIVSAEIRNIDRSVKNEYKVSAAATDKAGNETNYFWKTVVLPPEIKLEKTGQTRIDNSTGKKNTVTEIKLTNYEENIKYYKNLKLQRTIYVEGTEITENNFTSYFTEDARDDWKEITKAFEVKPGEIVEGIYKDKIPTESGFGHKETGYKLSWEIQDITDSKGKAISEESEELKVATANNAGNIKIRVEGKEENLEVDFNSGKFGGGKEKIKLSAAGSIKISISIEDEDYEPYETELWQQITSKNIGLSMAKEGFVMKGVNGKAKYSKYETRYEKGKWFTYEGTEYLSYNSETCLYLRIKEGYGENKIIRESGRIYLKAEPANLGGFTLSVCSEADYNANGITANPFQKVSLELEGEPENVRWIFGDKNESEGKKAEHIWGQSENRTGDTSEYIMTIEMGNIEEEIPVHIVDTKAGSLYGNEVWYGAHEILGNIEVKKEQTLVIGNSVRNEDIEIDCYSDEEEKYMGRLEIKGTLEIENGRGRVVITGTEENNKLKWKGIEVQENGKVVIKGTEIRGSVRGIAVDKGGKAEIKDSILKGNKTGIHLFGKLTADGIKVTRNEEYGIKEEKGCEIEIKKSEIKENTIDWYQAENGVLNREEIMENIED